MLQQLKQSLVEQSLCRAAGSEPVPDSVPSAHVDTAAAAAAKDVSGSSSSSLISGVIDDGMSVHLLDSSIAAMRIAGPSSSADDAYLQPAAAAAAAASINTAAVAPVDEAVTKANEETSAVNRLDMYKAIGIGGALSVLAGILDHEWVDAHQGLAMSLLFCMG